MNKNKFPIGNLKKLNNKSFRSKRSKIKIIKLKSSLEFQIENTFLPFCTYNWISLVAEENWRMSLGLNYIPQGSNDLRVSCTRKGRDHVISTYSN